MAEPDLQFSTDFELERITFFWTIHEFNTIRKLSQEKVIPSHSVEYIILPAPRHQHNDNKWWLEVFPDFESNGDLLLNLCTDRPLEDQFIIGTSGVLETSDNIEILGTKKQKKVCELRKGFIYNDPVYFTEIFKIKKDQLSSCIDSQGRLNIKCIVEFGSFINGENLLPSSTELQTSQICPFTFGLSKGFEVLYVTDLKLHVLTSLWKIHNFLKIRNFAKEEIMPCTGLTSPKFFFPEGMVDRKETLWWLRLNPSLNKKGKKDNVEIEFETDIKEGFFRFSVVAETFDRLEIAKSGGNRFQNIKEHGKFVFEDFLKPDQINDCLGSDDTLNIRCVIEKYQILTVKEEEWIFAKKSIIPHS
eukprot:GHVP01027546.1.p1 GENE.GHVP01027546.1~~GHVP01027546.1.p1  ORF type:complete len:360 (+),score=78.88 GHVP01027546.1:331-1410(+)